MSASATNNDKPSAPLLRVEALAGGLVFLALAACFLGAAAANIVSSLAIAAALYYAFKRRLRLTRPQWLLWLLLYLAVRLGTAALSPEPLVSFRYVAKEWHQLALLPGLIGLVALAPKRAPLVLIAALALNLLLAIFQFAELASGQQWLPLHAVSSSQTGALLKQPMTLGGVAMLTLFLPALLALPKRSARLIVALSLLILLVSGARSAWLGAAVGAAVLAGLTPALRRPLLLTVTLGLGLLLALPVTQQRLEQTVRQSKQMEIHYGSLARRLELWSAAWQMGNSRIAGVGPGRFRSEAATLAPGKKSRAHAHNMLLHIFAESGYLGVIAWLGWNLALAIALWQKRDTSGRAGLALLSALLAAGLFEVNQFDAEVASVYYLLLGAALASRQHPLPDG